MTTITAAVILDSVSPEGHRLTTLQLRYPRLIHSQMLTHRVFSRNSSSSRAVPVKRMIREVETDPVDPLKWVREGKGMSGVELLDPETAARAQAVWDEGRREAVARARSLAEVGAHKQYVNRVLEPYAHIDVVLSGTTFENFEALRAHMRMIPGQADPQPEIHALARAIVVARAASAPKRIGEGFWHLPYILTEEMGYPLDTLRKLSVARCARVSYAKVGANGKIDHEADLELFDRLCRADPPHLSPFEHVATPTWNGNDGAMRSNFRGWRQYRKDIPGESGERVA